MSKNKSRRYPAYPLLGIGAAIFDGERILIAERGGEPLRGWWSLPGGLMETGETLAGAVRREVKEETGLDVEPVAVLEIFERVMHDAEGSVEYHYVIIDYFCRVTGGTAVAGDDVSRVAWVTWDELQQYKITDGTAGVIEKAFRERARIGV